MLYSDQESLDTRNPNAGRSNIPSLMEATRLDAWVVFLFGTQIFSRQCVQEETNRMTSFGGGYGEKDLSIVFNGI